jgi:hypothetical protein
VFANVCQVFAERSPWFAKKIVSELSANAGEVRGEQSFASFTAQT